MSEDELSNIQRYGKKYYQAHKEKIKEYNALNREKTNRYYKQYFEHHPDSQLKSLKKYYEKNKEEILERSANFKSNARQNDFNSMPLRKQQTLARKIYATKEERIKALLINNKAKTQI